MTPASSKPTGAYRYPGVAPFKTDQRNVFFGRTQETAELYSLIRREPNVVLYGKSGLGKSSLLNAGIIPECEKDKIYAPVVVRFGAWTEKSIATPLNTLKTALETKKSGNTIVDRLLPDDASLWRSAKNRQLISGRKPLLLFDQVEEIFTYPDDQMVAFWAELSELLDAGIPLRFRRGMDTMAAITDEEEETLERPLDTRLVFAIRADKMHLLDRLTPYLPNLLRNCYELKALRIEDARSAITLPAQATGAFETPVFAYTNDALEKILRFLVDERDDRIEGILLQMLCEHYERKQVKSLGRKLLGTEEIGDPNEVIENYYEEKLAALTKEERRAAELLIEEGLVSEGDAIRLALHESFIHQEYKVDKDLLDKLVDSRLLRSEPFGRGGYTYELSHDRLIYPVVNARKTRREEERETENAKLKLEAERERTEKLKAQKSLQIVRALLGISMLAVITALYFYNIANQNSNLATRKAEEAESANRISSQRLKEALLEKKNRLNVEKQQLVRQVEIYRNADYNVLFVAAKDSLLAKELQIANNLIEIQKIDAAQNK